MSSDCCPEPSAGSHSKKFDYVLWGSATCLVGAYFIVGISPPLPQWLIHWSHGAVAMMNEMWWGLALSIFFVGWLAKIPREVVMAVLGTQKGLQGLLRATGAGLTLDLCNHGILVIAMRLYERGATIGQVMAFLIASPWNSFSMTIILFALVGLKLTLIFIFASALIALISGMVFDRCVEKGILPENPNRADLPENFDLKLELKKTFKDSKYTLRAFWELIHLGIKDSRPILKWIFFGVILSATLKTVLSPELFREYLGPSLIGLGITLVAATVIEVCSEGSVPIASDLVNVGNAQGNGFTFLMAGVSTDFTELLAIKETTHSWKVALFLPLITLPQVLILGLLLNWYPL